MVTTADAITYWSGMLATGHPLAQMALDYLSIPGTCIIPLSAYVILILELLIT